LKITSFAVIALLLARFTSDAQTIKPKSTYAKQTTYEIGGDIMLNSTEYKRDQTSITDETSSTTTNFIIDGTFGYFVIDHLKLAAEPVIQISFYSGSSYSRRLKLYFTPEYVFDLKSQVFPYLGCSAGYTSESYSSGENPTHGGFSWGLKGGVRVNAFGNALINIGISYYQETYNYNDSYLGDVKQHYNILGVKAGLSVFFR
jgi:hypothetical protein